VLDRSTFDRRTFLGRTGGALAGALAVAGCLSLDGGDGGGGGSNRTDFLADLPDSRPAVVPSFHAAYDYEPTDVVEALGGDGAMPDLATNLLDILADVSGVDPTGVRRLRGQHVRQVGHSGADVELAAPVGSDLVATGEFDAEAVAGWLEGNENLESLGSDRGYRRFGNAGGTVEAFTAGDGAVTYGNRRGTEADAATIGTAAIDGLTGDTIPAEATSPELFGLATSLPSGAARIGSAFDLVAERPDTGTDAVDATASSLVAAGLSASIEGETVAITRLLRYRRGRVAAPEDVADAVDRAVDRGEFLAGDWSVSASDRTVRIEGAVDAAALGDDAALLRRAVPAPGYADLTQPIDPRDLGRAAPPRVRWAPSRLEGGRFRIRHAGGPSVSDVAVAYTVDGERRRERWQGPVEPEDEHAIEAVPDGGTYLDVVWRPDTVDETILLRIGVREE